MIAAIIAAIILSLAVPVLGKWLLVGRVRAGRYPLWGGFDRRWWLAASSFAWRDLITWPAHRCWRLIFASMGARIGEGCHLGTARLSMPDLLEIGDCATLGTRLDLEPFVVEDGWLYLAPIGWCRAFIGSNVVVTLGGRVGADACVGEQSLVARDQVIPPAETWGLGLPVARRSRTFNLKG